eukprot:PhM_4_TR675/c2_g1_i2/m.78874
MITTTTTTISSSSSPSTTTTSVAVFEPVPWPADFTYIPWHVWHPQEAHATVLRISTNALSTSSQKSINVHEFECGNGRRLSGLFTTMGVKQGRAVCWCGGTVMRVADARRVLSKQSVAAVGASAVVSPPPLYIPFRFSSTGGAEEEAREEEAASYAILPTNETRFVRDIATYARREEKEEQDNHNNLDENGRWSSSSSNVYVELKWSVSGGITAAFVARRDLAPGEEIIIDTGRRDLVHL